MSAPVPTLRLPRDCAQRLVRWARVGNPLEVCGLLLGHACEEQVDVLDVAQLPNVETARPGDRFRLDPLDQLRVEQDARQRGLGVVGVWHSHPDHPAVPSETDRAAAWEGLSYVIVSLASDSQAEVRSWRLWESRFVEEQVSG